MKRLFLACATLLSLSASLALAGPTATCIGKTGQVGTFKLTMQSGDYTRTYFLHVPPQYKPDQPMPLVFNFHGWGGTAESQDSYTGMSAKADEAGFMVIHPEGVDQSWNAGWCCGTAATEGVDDVAFFRQMVKLTMADYCVDPSRVFSTGFSNGGFFSHRLACEASDVVAAVAPASSAIAVESCTPSRPIPVIQTQGTADLLVPYTAGKTANDEWAAMNKCGTATSVVYRKGGASCVAYNDCAQNATVEFCTVKGMPHDWPRAEGTPGWLDATDTFWDFFTKHPMP